jgi:hypothetical protein
MVAGSGTFFKAPVIDKRSQAFLVLAPLELTAGSHLAQYSGSLLAFEAFCQPLILENRIKIHIIIQVIVS